MQGTPVKSCMSTRARGELDLDARARPTGSQFAMASDVLLGDVGAVLGAQQVLGEHLEAVGELLGPGYRVEAVDLVAPGPRRPGCHGHQTSLRMNWPVFAAPINSPARSRRDGPGRRRR